jgi:hypothetical protein
LNLGGKCAGNNQANVASSPDISPEMDSFFHVNCYERWISKPQKSYHLKIIPSAFSIRSPERILARYVQLQDPHAAEPWDCRVS